MSEEQQEQQPAQIDARIELKIVDGGFLTANIEAVDEPDNRAVVFVRYVGRHLQSITDMAMREHKEVQQAVKDAQPEGEIITDVAPRLLGPDNKPLN